MPTKTYPYDVFLSHSAKDKAVVRPLAERLRRGGRQGKAECGRQKAEVGIHPSSFFLHPFPCAPLNQERHFAAFHHSTFFLLPFLRGSLAQFLYINWRPNDCKRTGKEPFAKQRMPLPEQDADGDVLPEGRFV